MHLEHTDISDSGRSLDALQATLLDQRDTGGALRVALRGQGYSDASDAAGFQDVSDQGVLEMILSPVLPPDTADLVAGRLLARFGDLNRVIAAPVARLRAVNGVGEAAIHQLKLVEYCARRMARARLLKRSVISSWQDLLTYCHICLSHSETEQLRVLYLDRKNGLIADELAAEGTVDHVPVYPREILRRALELNASAVILVHNHPSGDPSPSEADIAITQAIRAAGEMLSITLHDHLIIGASREFSFRSEGIL